MRYTLPVLALALALMLSAQPAAPAWHALPTGVTASLRGLDVRGEVIWASGSGGTWLRSTDGGTTWTHGVVTGAESLDFRGIQAFDAQTAVMISSGPAEKNQARIYRTADGGGHWTEVFRSSQAGMFLDAVKFWDNLHGIVLSDPVDGKFAILVTDDGGRTWRAAPHDRMPDALPKEGAFAASNSALAVRGKSDAWFGTGGGWHARVFVTRDRGRTWTDVNTPIAANSPASGIFSIAFADAKQGVAVGGDYQNPAASHHNIAYTTDGGMSWSLASSSVELYLSGIAVEQGRAIAVGSAGWATSPDTREWTAGGSQGFNAVAISGNMAYAVGADGSFAFMDLRTSDHSKP